ncbi:leucine-rich repeat and calponin homology domain-containing protein 1 isoform X1 [Xenopus laevis]|uniref:Leucine-rich repeat and calponin homology domain-containing protein 1 isoform X1 n=1 Tax=Xenopus laevis TaxID=8355 RepID=A0A8J1MBG0_XENLA|nr:leucine-rich repeat and calponin homology domain-containing protein 1 isoform X1 [Xenopus laevis]
MATLGSECQALCALPTQQQYSAASGVTNFSLKLPVNRGLERALEEAASSGLLNVSARKLKEFPRTSGSTDLADTVRADFSKNRLTEVPVEVCQFVSLEALNLYHNCIKMIPHAFVNLQMLTYLNIGRNQLSSLPACVCGLPLKVLIANNNKLGSLPEEIDQLQHLMELDVSCNEITCLPQRIGLLKSLRDLNVRRNHLKALPQEIVDLPLVKLDFSCNKVLVLPLCFRKMVQLQVLILENNPLQSPPAQICIKGKVHIFKYLSMQSCQLEKTGDGFYLHSIERPHLPQHVEESIEDIFPTKKDSDSGVGSDSGEKRLSTIEPCEEDSTSPSVPMSDILEEENLLKEEIVEQQLNNSLQVESPQNCLLGSFDKSYQNEAETLKMEYLHYEERRSEFDEPLQIQEESPWLIQNTNASEKQELNVTMINPLREAVVLLQDPTRLSLEIEDPINVYPLQRVPEAALNNTSVNGQVELQMSPILQNDIIIETPASQNSPQETENSTPTLSPVHSTIAFGLKPRSDPSLTLPPISFNKLTQAQNWDSNNMDISAEGGIDNVFIRPQRNLESVDPQFTIRRKMEQMREEKDLIDHLRENIEVRLKMGLPNDVGPALMDGVVLCHLANQIRPRSVGSIHVPSPAVPKLSMAKCRRNVENFLDACRKMGVPETDLCSPNDILQLNIRHIQKTVDALLAVGETAPQSTTFLDSWDLIGVCLLHILLFVFMCVSYHWNAK